jgi:hypothetical protein
MFSRLLRTFHLILHIRDFSTYMDSEAPTSTTCRTVGHEGNALGVLESGQINIPSKMILRRISYDTTQ